MKELKLLGGMWIGRACEMLAAAAPAWMEFNGVRVEAQPGDSPTDLRSRWEAQMDVNQKKYKAERQAYEQTPAGIAELAAAKKKADDEKRVRQEALEMIERSGVRTKYAWQPGMAEVSGFGDEYEGRCRDMVYAGLAWLEGHPGADLKATSYKNIYGILNAENEDTKSLEKVVISVCPDCSGAMHQTAMMACMYIAADGWAKFVEAMSARK